MVIKCYDIQGLKKENIVGVLIYISSVTQKGSLKRVEWIISKSNLPNKTKFENQGRYRG